MKLLIRATNWVGDAIMALPALRAVRAKFPHAEIAILARPYVAHLYRDQQIADRLIPYDSRSQHGQLSERGELVSQLREVKFDVALLLQNAFEAAWIAWRAKIRDRIGYNRDGRSLLLTKPVPVPKPGEIPPHEKFYYLELLRRVGWIETLPQAEFISLHVPQPSRIHAADILLAAGARSQVLRIAVGAGASYGSAKCWPPERFAQALNQFLAHADADVILFGTETEKDVSTAIAAGLTKAPIDLTGKTTIGDLPALLSQCQLFLGNDSGAMHVAAAVGLPVVTVFGPTDPLGTAPVTPRHSIVQEKPYCSPCFLRHCPTDHRCMKAVTPEAVATNLRLWLAEVHPG